VFETYIYDKGQTADLFTAALEAAAHRGVAVDLVLDSFGAGSMDKSHAKRLRDAGCHLVTFNDSTWYKVEEINYRTHRKILVIDGEVAFTGGVGVSDHWLGHAQDKKHWRDTQIAMRGPVARVLEGTFYENFSEGGDIVTPVLDSEPAEASPDDDTIVVKSSTAGGSNDLKRLYLLMLASARKTVDIQSPYFIADDSTAWAIKDAIGRGVVVRILMEGDRTDARPVKYASRSEYEQLLSIGVQLYEYQPTMMHAKVLVVDGVWSMFGSANFDNRSLELNDELNIAVRRPALAEQFLTEFERDCHASRRIELEAWRRRSYFDREREWFWSHFGEIF
jgi:cardiolipin synthase